MPARGFAALCAYILQIPHGIPKVQAKITSNSIGFRTSRIELPGMKLGQGAVCLELVEICACRWHEATGGFKANAYGEGLQNAQAGFPMAQPRFWNVHGHYFLHL